VSRWIGDIVEHRREVRRLKTVLLSRFGWSNVQIADLLGVTEGTIRSDVKGDITTNVDEALLREAAADLP
jgi:DNA-directed RNA polymerase specialized sigma24 family protein